MVVKITPKRLENGKYVFQEIPGIYFTLEEVNLMIDGAIKQEAAERVKKIEKRIQEIEEAEEISDEEIKAMEKKFGIKEEQNNDETDNT